MLHLKLSPEEFFSRHPVIPDPLVEKSIDVLLPNLRYKNNDVYFIFKNPIKIIVNDKKEFKTEMLLKNLSLTGEVFVMDIKIKCLISTEERDDGLKVNLKYMDRHYLYKSDICKFARAVESAILNIDIFDDENDHNDDDDDVVSIYQNNLDNYYFYSDFEENNSTYDDKDEDNYEDSNYLSDDFDNYQSFDKDDNY
jgi:hypothetical protein